MRGLLRAALFVFVAAAIAIAWRSVRLTSATAQQVVGQVLDDSQPVSEVRVRYKGQADFALTDDQGRFSLAGPPEPGAVVTAAKEGYVISGAPASPRPIEIRLTALPATDNPDYQWIDPAPNPTATGACGNCHQAIYDEWQTSGHAHAATNRHFQNLLDGSDYQGSVNHGWSMTKEYPEGIAVCWSCHAPTLELEALASEPRHVSGVAAAGVHCDFCHKIQEVNIEHVGLTHGRFAYKLLRPSNGQLFFGPLDDVDRSEDSYSPLERESRYCADCHEGTIFGVHVYSTFTEWRASPAAREGRQCQSCHMTPSGELTNVAPGMGGIERDPRTLASHTFLPGGLEAMLRRAVKLSFTAERRDDGVRAAIRIEAHDVGHRVPTGFIDRQLLLVVEPLDAEGQACDVLSGPLLPSPAGSALAGKPGRLFAKLLTDAVGHSPAPFWRAGVSIADTRLSPDEPEELSFRFSPQVATVRVRLNYRRFWQDVADAKHWPDNDILIHDRTFAVE
jgi:hypothetical protein